MSISLPPVYESELDENGIKTRIYYKVNSNNELLKVTQKIKVISLTQNEIENIKRKKRIEDRRKRIKHFNNATVKNNSQITVIDDKYEVNIDDPSDDTDDIDTIIQGLTKLKESKHTKPVSQNNLDKTYVPPHKRAKYNIKKKKLLILYILAI